jgi:oxaloacetate decarboxylase gamma subunit
MYIFIGNVMNSHITNKESRTMSTIWSDTLLLMLLGMGTVFTFLLLLIISVTIMSSVIKRFSAAEDEPSADIDVAAIAVVAATAYHLHHRHQPTSAK